MFETFYFEILLQLMLLIRIFIVWRCTLYASFSNKIFFRLSIIILKSTNLSVQILTLNKYVMLTAERWSYVFKEIWVITKIYFSSKILFFYFGTAFHLHHVSLRWWRSDARHDDLTWPQVSLSVSTSASARYLFIRHTSTPAEFCSH